VVHAEHSDAEALERDGQEFDEKLHTVFVGIVDRGALQNLIA
jgi:hypothetical protein